MTSRLRSLQFLVPLTFLSIAFFSGELKANASEKPITSKGAALLGQPSIDVNQLSALDSNRFSTAQTTTIAQTTPSSPSEITPGRAVPGSTPSGTQTNPADVTPSNSTPSTPSIQQNTTPRTTTPSSPSEITPGRAVPGSTPSGTQTNPADVTPSNSTPSTPSIQQNTTPSTTPITPNTTTPSTIPGTTTPSTTPGTTTPSTTPITPDSSPGTTTPTPTTIPTQDLAPGRATRSGSSYVGIGGNIGIGDGDISLGQGSFTVLSKIGLTQNFSVRPSVLINNDVAILIPVTYDFSFGEGPTGGLGFAAAPYLGVGAAISTGGGSSVGLLLTGGIDVPLSSQFTATAAVNASVTGQSAVGIMLGVGYNFAGF